MTSPLDEIDYIDPTIVEEFREKRRSIWRLMNGDTCLDRSYTPEGADQARRMFRIKNGRDPMTAERGKYVRITVQARGPYDDRTIHDGLGHGSTMIQADRDQNHGSRGYWETVAGFSLGQCVMAPRVLDSEAVILGLADDGETCWVGTGPRTLELALWELVPA